MKIRFGLLGRSLLCPLLLAATFSVGWCQDSAETGPKSVLQKNMEAMGDEDMATVKSTMHSESPVYSKTVEITRKLFERYDLEYEIEDMKTISRSERVAEVRVIQVTRKVSGPKFRKNKTTVVNTLKKEDGQWKVWNSKIENIEYLDTD